LFLFQSNPWQNDVGQGKGGKMKRRITLLGLAAVSALALAVSVGASVAPAANFAVEGKTATLAATNAKVHTFFAEYGPFECEKASFSATQATTTAATVLAAPTYSGCSLGKSLTMTVEPHGCTYRLHPGSEIAKGEFEGTMDLVCPIGVPGLDVKLTLFCLPHRIVPQESLGPVKYKNLGSGSTREVEITAAIKKMGYFKATGTGCESWKFTAEGRYEGVWKMAASREGKQVGVFIE
jgi:hypothetical protein